MLLQMSIANYLSFRDEVTLNFSPAKSRVMKEHELSDDRGKKVKALPVAVLYGANASGKSNLIKAAALVKQLVVYGTRPNDDTEVKPHLLDTSLVGEPSRFEFVFKHNGVVYTYGFCVSISKVHEEWLFAYRTSRESKIFERIDDNGRVVVDCASQFAAESGGAQFLDYVAKGTRPNQLFLTEANDKNIESIRDVVSWFKDYLQVIQPESRYNELVYRSSTDEIFRGFISEFLRAAGTGVEGLNCSSEPLDEERHLAGISPRDRNIISSIQNNSFINVKLNIGRYAAAIVSKGDDGLVFHKIKSRHRRNDGADVEFELSEESDGTRRILDIAPAIHDVWDNERVYFIDEIDRSFHPHLTRFFLQAIIAGVVEKGARGQFVITTHDTNLLDRSLLRRDEIWFMEKDGAGGSHLTSLAEYKLSEGLSYQNGYLNGRFGAIPFLGEYRQLLR